jgi:hypothetical protein
LTPFNDSFSILRALAKGSTNFVFSDGQRFRCEIFPRKRRHHQQDRNQGKNYYAIGGVLPTATAEDIRGAYRRRAKELHPDH